MFPIRNGLKQGDASSLLLFYCALELVSRRVQLHQDGLKLNGTHLHSVYTDDVNVLCRSVHAIQKNTGDLVVASKEIELDANVDKTKYMVMSRDQNAGQSHCIKIDISSFEEWKSSNIWEQT